MRREAKHDYGKFAACLLATLGNETQETDGEYVRAYVGALLMAEAMVDLRRIRIMFQKTLEALSKR